MFALHLSHIIDTYKFKLFKEIGVKCENQARNFPTPEWVCDVVAREREGDIRFLLILNY